MTGLTSLLLYLMGITTQIWMAYMGEFNGGSHAYLLKWAIVSPSCTISSMMITFTVLSEAMKF